MRKTILVTGIISLFLLLLGVLFKMQYYPGASIMLILGVALLNLLYLPLLLIYLIRQKESPVILKVAQGIAILPAWMLTFGILFKIQHWPGASALLFFGMILLLFVFLPLFIIGQVKNKNTENKKRAIDLLTVSLFGALVLGYGGTHPASRVILQDINIDRNLSYSIRLVKLNNNIATAGMERALVENEKRKDLYKNAMTIAFKAKELHLYIDHLRDEIIMHTQAVPQSVADTLSIASLQHPDDYDTPTHYFIGSNPKNITGESTELKKKLEEYITAINAANEQQFPATMLTPDLTNQGQETISWEVSNFYHTTVSGTLVILKNLQLQILVMEGNQLHDILNRMQELNANKK
ncbi:MAG: hypothetical protein ACHQRM_15440 [Bacteroidia bacterium]